MKRLFIVVGVFAVIVGVLTVAATASAQQRLALFVFTATDPSGFTDQTTKDRAAAVADAIKYFGKSKFVVPVATREDGQVILEITRRVKEPTKTSIAKSMWKNNSWSRSPDSLQPFLYGSLTVGAFTTELRSDEPESSGESRNLAKVAEQWVRDNRAKF